MYAKCRLEAPYPVLTSEQVHNNRLPACSVERWCRVLDMVVGAHRCQYTWLHQVFGLLLSCHHAPRLLQGSLILDSLVLSLQTCIVLG